MVGFWGECGPECHGEMPTRGSSHNLAGASFNDLWTTNIFDLRPMGSGICHTYNPPEKSQPGNADLLYALFGDATSVKVNLAEASFRGLTIYLHPPGGLWPGLSISESIQLNINENVDITFQMAIVTYLNTDKAACIERESYSLTDCLHGYVEQTARCQLDWFEKQGPRIGNYCDGVEDIERYMKVLETINRDDNEEVFRRTGWFLVP
jgi:hypothetical protein